jgi:type VI secretion system secreted protein Hcp
MGIARRVWTTVAGCGLLACVASLAPAQDSTFVLIPSLAGESQDPDHLGWIDAYGLSAESVAGATAGDPDHRDIHVLKGTDVATPLLFLRLSQGTNLGLVRIEVCREGTGGQECYYKLDLENAVITDIALSGSACIDPTTSCTPAQTESVSFDYSKITWRYIGFGKAKSSCGCWDLAKNGSCSCTP